MINYTKAPIVLPKLRFKGFEYSYEKLDLNINTGTISSTESIKSGCYTYFDRSYEIKSINQYSNDGEFVIVPSECYLYFHYINGKFSHHSKTYRIHGNCNIKFLYYFLQSKKDIFSKMGEGSSVTRYTKNIYNNLFIFKDIETQTKIAHFFSLLDKQIELWENKLQLVELICEYYIEKLYSKNRIKTSNIKIEEFIKETNNRNNKGLYSKQGCVSSKFGIIFQDAFFKKNIKANNFLNYKIIYPNEYVFNPARINIGSIGRNKTNTILIFSPMYISFCIIKNNIDKNYIEYFFKSKYFLNTVKNLCKGSVRDVLSWTDFKSINFIEINYKSNWYLLILRKFYKYIQIIKKRNNILNVKRKIYLINIFL